MKNSLKIACLAFSFSLLACTSFETYGPQDPSQAPSVILSTGFPKKIPANSNVQLKGIDDHKKLGRFKPNGYSVAPGNHKMYYQFVDVTERGLRYEIKWLKYPYVITANLKSGYRYAPIFETDGVAPRSLCLFEEKEGITGQKSALISFDTATKIACGEIDDSVSDFINRY